jgi:hypothetical protein
MGGWVMSAVKPPGCGWGRQQAVGCGIGLPSARLPTCSSQPPAGAFVRLLPTTKLPTLAGSLWLLCALDYQMQGLEVRGVAAPCCWCPRALRPELGPADAGARSLQRGFGGGGRC